MPKLVGRITPTRVLTRAIRVTAPPGLVRWPFGHYRDDRLRKFVLGPSR